MQLHFAKSCERDAARAVEEAVAGLGARRHCGLVLAFCTEDLDLHVAEHALARALGDTPWVCSVSSGVIAGPELQRHGLVVGAFCGDDFRAGVGLVRPRRVDGGDAGRRAVAQAVEKLPPRSDLKHRAVLLLPDIGARNSTEIVRGAFEEAGSRVTWAGGGMGEMAATEVPSEATRVAAVVIDSTTPFGVGVRHGWRPYGPVSSVTRARGSTVLELDYRNAFDVYSETAAELGDRVTCETFPNFARMHPLGIPQISGSYVVRDLVSVGPSGELRCVAEVPEQSLVRVMVSERSQLLEAGRAAALDALAPLDAAGQPHDGALLFGCFSRYPAMGGLFEEVEVVARALGSEMPLVGCLTRAEVGALFGAVPQFLNKSAVILAF